MEVVKKPRGRPRKVKVEEVKEVVKPIEDKLEKANEVLNKIYTNAYPEDKIAVYMFYSGNDIDTHKFIKTIQQILDHFKLGSQVVIHAPERYESIGINNCYHTLTMPNNWTDICLAKNDCIQLLIKERPRMSPTEIIKLMKQTQNYEDDFIIIKEFVYDTNK